MKKQESMAHSNKKVNRNYLKKTGWWIYWTKTLKQLQAAQRTKVMHGES